MTQKTKLEVISEYLKDHPEPFCTRDDRAVRIICDNMKIASGADGIIYPLIREGDAQAALADAQAENVRKDDEIDRLWAALESIELSIDALPDDMEDYSKMNAREMRRQALEVVKDEVKALKGSTA